MDDRVVVRLVAPDGWDIDLSKAGDDPRYRMTRWGVAVTDCATLTEVEDVLHAHGVSPEELVKRGSG